MPPPSPTSATQSGDDAPRQPVRTLQDIEALEQQPMPHALPWLSTYDMLADSARRHAQRVALTYLPDGRPDDTPVRWTYAELLGRIHQTANLLHALAIRPDDVIAILLPGGLAYQLALWGGEAAATVQPLNPLLSDDTLVDLMRASGASTLFAHGADDDTGLLEKALRLRGRVPTLRQVLLVSPVEGTPTASGDGLLDFHTLRAQQPTDRLLSGRVFQRSDTAALFHTGGTTGSPKLARHSHGAQVFTAWANATVQAMRPTDVLINGYPMFHVAGVLPGALCSLHVGMETIIPSASLFRNPQVIRHYWRLVEAHGCTLVSAVPTALAALMAVPLDGADVHTIRSVRTGAAPLPPELAQRIHRTLGVVVNESLGMTETVGLSSVAPPGMVAPAGCVGWRLPYCQLRIAAVGADGQPEAASLPVGATGMVLYKGPNVFDGYLDPAETAKAFTSDGWLITGDLGFLDDQGRLHLNGRAKDLIIRGGHNIDPKVIEDALGSHPAVQLCAAVGAPDAYAGELPVTFACLRTGATATEAELLAHTAAHVNEAPARPRSVTVLDALPVTQVGKIFKPALRELAAQAVAQALVQQVCDGLHLPTAQQARAELTDDPPGERRVRIVLPTPADPTLAQRLHEALDPLPVRLIWP